MNKSEMTDKLSALIDGTLPEAEAAELCRRLESDPELREEHAALLALRDQLRTSLAPPEVRDEEWEEIALRVVSRSSQALGWTLFLPGLASLIVGALVAFFLDPSVPLWERLAAGGVVAGLSFLLICAIADRARAMRTERYDRVDR